MLGIENLIKTYANGVQALNGVSLAIPRGMFGLLGPNGAGRLRVCGRPAPRAGG
jgi:ABC-type multidrug transport system ATPase subunit